jgi:peptidoglycan/xylan/chitin deacetylase (PgdA/CDA1 family)
MTLVLLRDDDANATTDPAMLARTYAPLLDAGLPITFSVIPRVSAGVLAPDGKRERFIDPALAPFAPDQPLERDTPLAVWLRQHRDVARVAQHGLSHARVRDRTEFGALTHEEAGARLREGSDLLQRALGTRPMAFVPPWDALSPGSLSAALALFPVVSTGWVNLRKLPVRFWPQHLSERVSRREALSLDRSLLLRHRGGRLHGATDAADVPGQLRALTRGAAVAVVVLHHWMFPGPEVHPAIEALARALRDHRVVGPEELARDGLSLSSHLPTPRFPRRQEIA